MASDLAEILLRLAAGFPVGQGAVAVPVEVSSRMTERQLDLFIAAMGKAGKEDELLDEPDPREYHREWAKQNKIPRWYEAEIWERKSGGCNQ